MNLGLTTFGADGGRSGIGRYVNELLPRMAASGRVGQCDVLAHESELAGLHVPSRFNICRISERVRPPVPNLLWHQTVLPYIARRNRYDLLFYTAANRRLAGWAGPAVGAVHDLASLHVDDKYDALHTLYIRRVLPHLVRRLTYVVTLSQSSRQDIIDATGIHPDRVVVVPLASNGPRPPSLMPCPVVGPYLLYVARLEHPGKNHVRLIQAFEQLWLSGRRNVRLVLAGPDRERAAEIRATAAATRCAQNIVFTGFVSEAKLDALYRNAAGFVFPSLFEGFGLPLLEAMDYDLPVATSNRSSMPEVAGQAAVYFDPFDTIAMTRCMAHLLEDEPLRAHLIEAGRAQRQRFSWNRTAAATLDVMEAALASAGGLACLRS